MSDVSTFGAYLRDLREGRRLSQADLAALLCATAGAPTCTRHEVSRWERDRHRPGRYWLPHLATALAVPLPTLEAEMRRRTLLYAPALLALLPAERYTARELTASIASGDPGPLGSEVTTRRVDVAIAALVGADRAMIRNLLRWASDGASAELRTNATSVLNKASPDDVTVDESVRCLIRDTPMRAIRRAWVLRRAGTSTAELGREVLNPCCPGSRWVAAVELGGRPDGRGALLRALRTEPVRENVRTIGLLLQGESPLMST